MKIYKPPLLSKVALWIAHHLPDRIWAACAIGALHMIDEHVYDMEIHEEDGSIVSCYGIDEIKIENIRRDLWYNWLKAKAEEVENGHGTQG